MRILLINGTYGIGSTGKIVESLKTKFDSLGHECFAIYGRCSSIKNDKRVIKGCYELESKIYHLLAKISGNLYGGLPFSTKRIICLIKKIKPDVIHLHCLNGYFVSIYKLISFLKKNNYNVVLTNHAEFMFTANCGYSLECDKWKNQGCKDCSRVKEFNGNLSFNRTSTYFNRMKKAFLNFNNLKITNVSDWLTNRVSQSEMFGSFKNNVTILNPLLSNHLVCSDINPYDNNAKNIFYCTADFSNPEKGGFNIIKIAKKLVEQNFVFWIKSGVDVGKISLPKNVKILSGKINIADYYHYANCSIILSKAETFSMVVAESLFCGTPIVGFKAGGPETIAIEDYSVFVDYGDIDSFTNGLLALTNKSIDKELLSQLAKNKYDLSKIANQYLEIYQK